MSTLCLPISLEAKEVDQLDEIVQRSKPLQRNDHIYHAGDTFQAVYAVRSGCVKNYIITNTGVEQVTGFYLPGEVFGMDGISTREHTNASVALETSAICMIPFERLQELSIAIPSLQSRFFQLMGKTIGDDQQLITLLGKNTAEERLATLLLSLSTRNLNRKLSSTHFRLPMSRADIANYLGLTVETVSRVFGRFQKQGILEANKKEITIKDISGLKKLTNEASDIPSNVSVQL